MHLRAGRNNFFLAFLHPFPLTCIFSAKRRKLKEKRCFLHLVVHSLDHVDTQMLINYQRGSITLLDNTAIEVIPTYKLRHLGVSQHLGAAFFLFFFLFARKPKEKLLQNEITCQRISKNVNYDWQIGCTAPVCILKYTTDFGYACDSLVPGVQMSGFECLLKKKSKLSPDFLQSLLKLLLLLLLL